jgi:hypothetical protein
MVNEFLECIITMGCQTFDKVEAECLKSPRIWCCGVISGAERSRCAKSGLPIYKKRLQDKTLS